MKKVFALSVFFSVLIMGCAAMASDSQVIHGVEVSKEKLRIQVISNGCTTKESFALHWQGDNLIIERIKPDHCRRMPHKKWLEFSLPKNVTSFNIANKFSY